jgi:hypothetical protein
MQRQTQNPDTTYRDKELDEELAGILTAISVVSKRLAVKLRKLAQQAEQEAEGGESSGQI